MTNRVFAAMIRVSVDFGTGTGMPKCGLFCWNRERARD